MIQGQRGYRPQQESATLYHPVPIISLRARPYRMP
jgi:hypothetical protein